MKYKKSRRREQVIVKLKDDGLSFQDIADMMKVSKQRVYFLYNRAKYREKDGCGQKGG